MTWEINIPPVRVNMGLLSCVLMSTWESRRKTGGNFCRLFVVSSSDHCEFPTMCLSRYSLFRLLKPLSHRFQPPPSLHNTETRRVALIESELERVGSGRHAARHRTSADGSGEVPHGRVAGVGDARERAVAVQHVAGDAAVLHAVAHRKAVAAAQHGLGRNAGIAAGRAVELCGREREKRREK